MTMTPYEILQKPIVTEKSLDAKERHRTLCFRVHPGKDIRLPAGLEESVCEVEGRRESSGIR